jgi:acetone carboxylase gamma subunit
MKKRSIQIGEKLRIERKDGQARYLCNCGRDLGSSDENFKSHCLLRETKATEMGPGYEAFDEEMADRMCFREFFCPACGARHATEMARVGDPILWDIKIEASHVS